MPATRIIINADDFGLSAGNTDSIVRCFESGCISSTTIMANGSDFQRAVMRAEEHGFSDRIGLHAVITHGPPLSTAMERYCDSDGYLAVGRRPIWAPRHLRRSIHEELRAQVQRVLDAGIRPTHIDSHEHALNSFPFATVALRVAREFRIPAVRLARNAFYSRTIVKTAFKTSFNWYLRTAGARTVRWFTDVKPYFLHRQGGGPHLPGSIELMTHPAAALTEPIDGATREVELLLSESFRDSMRGAQLITYRDL